MSSIGDNTQNNPSPISLERQPVIPKMSTKEFIISLFKMCLAPFISGIMGLSFIKALLERNIKQVPGNPVGVLDKGELAVNAVIGAVKSAQRELSPKTGSPASSEVKEKAAESIPSPVLAGTPIVSQVNLRDLEDGWGIREHDENDSDHEEELLAESQRGSLSLSKASERSGSLSMSEASVDFEEQVMSLSEDSPPSSKPDLSVPSKIVEQTLEVAAVVTPNARKGEELAKSKLDENLRQRALEQARDAKIWKNQNDIRAWSFQDKNFLKIMKQYYNKGLSWSDVHEKLCDFLTKEQQIPFAERSQIVINFLLGRPIPKKFSDDEEQLGFSTEMRTPNMRVQLSNDYSTFSSLHAERNQKREQVIKAAGNPLCDAGQLYQSRIDSVKNDEDTAMSMCLAAKNCFQEAIKLGNRKAIGQYALLILNYPKYFNIEEFKALEKWLKLEANREKGDEGGLATYALGLYHLEHDKENVNYQEVRDYFKKAAEKGHHLAAERLKEVLPHAERTQVKKPIFERLITLVVGRNALRDNFVSGNLALNPESAGNASFLDSCDSPRTMGKVIKNWGKAPPSNEAEQKASVDLQGKVHEGVQPAQPMIDLFQAAARANVAVAPQVEAVSPQVLNSNEALKRAQLIINTLSSASRPQITMIVFPGDAAVLKDATESLVKRLQSAQVSPSDMEAINLLLEAQRRVSKEYMKDANDLKKLGELEQASSSYARAAQYLWFSANFDIAKLNPNAMDDGLNFARCVLSSTIEPPKDLTEWGNRMIRLKKEQPDKWQGMLNSDEWKTNMERLNKLLGAHLSKPQEPELEG